MPFAPPEDDSHLDGPTDEEREEHDARRGDYEADERDSGADWDFGADE